LREQYLYNLEGALRERDASQVLRLTEKYQMDKDAAARDFAVKQLDAANQQAEEIQQLKQSEADKVQALQDAYNFKKQQEAEQYNKDIQDAQIQYQRQLKDLNSATDDKLKKLSDGWVAEYNLDAQKAQEIYNLLNSYFGPSGYVDALYAYMVADIEQQAVNAATSLRALGMGAAAESGISKATGVTMAGSGIQTTPASTSGHVGGSVSVAISLSSGLEGKIVSNALAGVSAVVSKVAREQ